MNHIYTVYRVTDTRRYRMGQVESTFPLDGASIAAMARANIRNDNNDPAFVSGDLLEVYESFNEMGNYPVTSCIAGSRIIA